MNVFEICIVVMFVILVLAAIMCFTFIGFYIATEYVIPTLSNWMAERKRRKYLDKKEVV